MEKLRSKIYDALFKKISEDMDFYGTIEIEDGDNLYFVFANSEYDIIPAKFTGDHLQPPDPNGIEYRIRLSPIAWDDIDGKRHILEINHEDLAKELMQNLNRKWVWEEEIEHP